jgi:hypothetical protein
MIGPSKTLSTNRRIAELDLLRFLALCLILFRHNVQFVAYPAPLQWLHDASGYVGLGLFSLLSGYSLHHVYGNHVRFPVKRYIRARMVRVYVPYCIALLSYLALFGKYGVAQKVNLSWQDVVGNVLCLQVILFPVVQRVFILWFVGLIMVFYVLYPVIWRAKSIGKTVAVSAVIAAAALLIRITYGLIDIRFFLFFPVFILGVAMSGVRIPQRLSKRGAWSFAFAFSALAMLAYIVHIKFNLPYVRDTPWSALPLRELRASLLIALCIAACSSVALLAWMRIWMRSLTAAPARVALFLSSGAYFTYLFHEQCLVVGWRWWNGIVAAPLLIDHAVIWIMAGMCWLVCAMLERRWMSKILLRSAANGIAGDADGRLCAAGECGRKGKP